MTTEGTINPSRPPEQIRSESNDAQQARERRKASEAELSDRAQERREDQQSASQERAVDLKA